MILTAVVSGVLGLAFGPRAVPPAIGFGLLATLIQVGAVAVLRQAAGEQYATFLKRYAIGMGLRLLGVTVMAVAIVARRDLFLPLPTAFGFLGVLVPLLFLEARLTR
jgi:hypothetical protein